MEIPVSTAQVDTCPLNIQYTKDMFQDRKNQTANILSSQT